MANKKIFMSVTATAALASVLFGAEQADAASHKVQSGESLWSIAQQYSTSVNSLKSINKLSSDIIYPNQVIETSSAKSSSSSNSKPTTSTTKSTTYTVKSGDTLSGIASKHGISLSNLMKWNNLDTTLIYPGNKLVVSKSSTNSSASSSNSTSSSSGKVASSSVYVVKSGDTLSGIASRNGVTVANLKKWNSLKSDLILIGQKLNIGESSSDSKVVSSSSSNTPTADVDYNVNKLISTAKSLNGTKYVWGGATTSGFDCSGFIYYVYKQAGMNISRTSAAGYFDRSFYVNSPQKGDLVFFEGTYKTGISHMGIYIGDNQFIHASSSGVQITSLSNSYWKSHFDSYKRFY
ncbi:LysM peptidoglycan-binding domain-containing protein [Oceanobacillus massiliensis]|uniref:C40 family peptidase n=1 Tax=Oceanobacillus massiliensis TaxID=1465765 RepID=UPI000288BDA4|nr:peptidoglycan endopeptidase [Oceanobacillus massiliensis]